MGMVGFLKMELPTRTVLLCDGGFMVFGGETYSSKDDAFGIISGVQTPDEGTGGAVPSASLTFKPATTNAGQLAQPGMQGSRVRFWVCEYHDETGLLVGTPDLQFEGQVDQIIFSAGSTRELEMSIVSTSERLFEGNLGNALSSSWHKRVWPGELGHDNATGLGVPVAWGAESPNNSGMARGTFFGTPLPDMSNFR